MLIKHQPNGRTARRQVAGVLIVVAAMVLVAVARSAEPVLDPLASAVAAERADTGSTTSVHP